MERSAAVTQIGGRCAPSPHAILASILLVIGISTAQKHRTERTLEALRDLTNPRALVMRSESTRPIPAREVVPGDIVLLNEGDRVPADGQVLESALLALDESLLTRRKCSRG